MSVSKAELCLHHSQVKETWRQQGLSKQELLPAPLGPALDLRAHLNVTILLVVAEVWRSQLTVKGHNAAFRVRRGLWTDGAPHQHTNSYTECFQVERPAQLWGWRSGGWVCVRWRLERSALCGRWEESSCYELQHIQPQSRKSSFKCSECTSRLQLAVWWETDWWFYVLSVQNLTLNTYTERKITRFNTNFIQKCNNMWMQL